jgi:hypothetical protein
MAKKKTARKDKQFSKWLKEGGRSGVKKDFFNLLKRASQPL